MTFPDQSHINRIRDALHQRSGNGASVMVGSGFSRNAERIILSANPMPTWQDLVDHFHDTLYPKDSANHRLDAPRPAVDNVRVAQEYEAAFGSSALHNTLRRLVPDDDYTPGSEHQRLLQLPWRDIYTTNWDTLLERSRDQVPERHYSVVSSVEGIPMASRPRIVKLHGSLPAQFPLIVTEEHYRTYPTKFAPFVNTVQQAMMETAFVLIGFSGDDPNFLNWSGWVRDNLGQSAPKIYLAGWLKLSTHRRRMLENRNVVPIDLALHPKADEWPEPLRDRYATKWLLHTLEEGRPYNITSWPTPSSQPRDEIPSILEPVETARLGEPEAEPRTQGTEPTSSPDDVRAITGIWRKNRMMYPGWLTMPSSNRQAMEHSTDDWGHTILASLPSLKPNERLIALRELLWRENLLLMPMHPDLKSAIQQTLDSMDCHNRKIDGVTAPAEDWAAIREDWRNTAVALVTAARFRFDGDAFEKAVKALEPFLDEDPNLWHQIHHEKCLWALYGMDFDSLDILLADWKTENCDPAWMMRKSALLWETRRNSEAADLLNHAIVAVKGMPPDENSLASLSRESWATFVALDWDNRLTSLDRLKELVPMRCDPFGERQSVTEGLGVAKAEEDPPLFDINRRRGTRERWINYDPYQAAYRAVRLSELAGLPPFTEYSTVWAEVLRKAAEQVADHDLEFAVRLLLRASNGDNDNSLGRVLTRTRVATMQTELAAALAQFCLNAMDQAMGDHIAPALATQQRFNTSAEVLSRLTIRLGPDQAESILDKAVGYCRNAELAKSFVAGTIKNLLMRSWEALPEERRQDRAMSLLGADIVGLNNVKPVIEYSWPDPGEVVEYSDTQLLRTAENEPQWHSAADLIVRGLADDITARRRASTRMIPLVHSNLLTENESQEIAATLWSARHTPKDGLPANTKLYHWEFLSFPEPAPGLAEERFITKWLPDGGKTGWQHKSAIQLFGNSPNGLNHDTLDVDSRLWQIGQAMLPPRSRGKQLTLSDAKKQDLVKLVEIWADATIPEFAMPDHPLFSHAGQAHQERFRVVSSALSIIIGRIEVTKPLGEKLYTKMQALLKCQMPVFSLAAGLAEVTPDHTQEVATALRIGITSDDYQFAATSVSGMHRWLEAASDPESKVLPPPCDLVREIGIAIASRRNTVITPSLQLAAWIFDYGQDPHKEILQPLLEDGLRYLAQELRYDRKHEAPDEVPRQRLYCATLAAAMAKNGLYESPVVAHWLEIAKADPLPEVRQAVA